MEDYLAVEKPALSVVHDMMLWGYTD